MSDTYTPEQFADLGLTDWHASGESAQARFSCGSFTDAGRFAGDVAAVCDEQDHHADLDVRYPDVLQVTTSSHDAGGLTDRDAKLARAVSDLAASRGHSAEA